MRRRLALVAVLLASGCASGHAEPDWPGVSRGAAPRERSFMPSARPEPSRAPSAAPEAARPTAPGSDYDDDADEAIDDEPETTEPPVAENGQARPHPLDGQSLASIERLLQSEPDAIGSVSLGVPSGGGLFNAVQMPDDERWELVDRAHVWGTQETVDYLRRSIAKVHAQFPHAQKLYIGHLSAKSGGPLSPHLSHQAGRDVDIGYFYSDEKAGWYARATANNLDLPKTWAFVRALITETDIEMILIDHSLQSLLRDYARRSGEDPAWLDEIFSGVPGKSRPLILHAKGHATHLHARFYNPIAQETGRRTHALFLKRGLIHPPTYYLSHKAKNGETLGMLSRKYGVSVPALKQANGLKKTLIRAGRVYRIPKRGSGVRAPGPISIPPRRLPPFSPTATASAE